MQLKEDGSFEITGAHPGAYHVIVISLEGGPVLSLGKAAVDVSKNNVDGVAITIASPVARNGSVRTEGDVKALELAQGRKLSFTGIRIQLTPVEGIGMEMAGGSVNGEGLFALDKVGLDKYRVSVFNLPAGTWLKSIRSGDQEVLELGLDLSAGGSPGPLEVTLGLGSGQLDGTVQDAKQQTAAGSLVTIVPEPFRPDRVDLFRTATSGQTGHFALDGIAPGIYEVYAWSDELEPGSQMDPEFLKKHESKGARVTVKENSREQLVLPQILVDPAAHGK